MSTTSIREDDWQAKATAAAIAEARKIALGSGPLMNTPVGRLSDLEWGWILAGALFGWITTRCEQAIAEGIDREGAVRKLDISPSPDEVAIVRSILPDLADQTNVDWSKPLSSWSKQTMTEFLLFAWRLIKRADVARGQAPGILRKSTLNAKHVDVLNRNK